MMWRKVCGGYAFLSVGIAAALIASGHQFAAWMLASTGVLALSNA